MRKYKASIEYTIDATHPNFKYMSLRSFKDHLTYEDIYSVSDDLIPEEDVISYIKRDLCLVAGGGYNSKHIHNVKFDIERI